MNIEESYARDLAKMTSVLKRQGIRTNCVVALALSLAAFSLGLSLGFNLSHRTEPLPTLHDYALRYPESPTKASLYVVAAAEHIHCDRPLALMLDAYAGWLMRSNNLCVIGNGTNFSVLRIPTN